MDEYVRNILGNTGPTGPTGYNERYLSITSQRISKSSLISDTLTITIEKYLSYYSGDSVKIKSIELNPNNASAYFSRGLYYHDLKEYEKAIADFTKIIEIDPANGCSSAAHLLREKAYEQLEKS
jgi:tetratricopeptide (TPR) repeat protein